MERISIDLREAGIIVPQKDPNLFNEIMTYGMRPCFAFSLRDPESQVGLLAHLDNIGDFSLLKMIKQTTPILKNLGAKNLIVETANTKKRVSKTLFIRGAITELRRNKFEVIPSRDSEGKETEWKDVGKASGAILSIRNGLTGFSYDGSRLLLRPNEIPHKTVYLMERAHYVWIY